MSGLEPTSDPAASATSAQQTTTPTTPTPPLGSSVPKPLTKQRPPGYASAGRRTHRKSRTGCSRCKARRIKCDERHPACLNCISHGVECPFLSAEPHVNKTRAASNAHSRSSASPAGASPAGASSPYHDAPPVSPEGGELPLLELELLHNFTTKTYTTLTADSSVWPFWRDDVVQHGLTCDYIMQAILAVSALHLASQRPDRRDFYVAEGILLHQKASRSAMRVMATASDKIDKDQGASLFLFSMLTLFFALASPRRSNPDGTFFIGESGFPDWAFLLSGSKSIIDAVGKPSTESFLGPYLHYGARRWHAQRGKQAEQCQQQQGYSLSPSSSNPHHHPHHPPSEPLLAPLRARIAAAVTNPARLQTYTHALDELELALVVRSRDSGDDSATPRDVLDVMLWLWVVSDEFVPLLREPAQEAVAIFAHFCVLLKHHESHWWLKGWGDHVMGRAVEILDEEHRGWIEWPMWEMEGVGGGKGR